jgi:hypothetical protein
MNKELNAEEIISQKISEISSWWDSNHTSISSEELLIISKKLSKLKKVSSILKEFFVVESDTSLDGSVDFYTLYFTGEFPNENWRRLTKEKFDILLEWLQDENN